MSPLCTAQDGKHTPASLLSQLNEQATLGTLSILSSFFITIPCVLLLGLLALALATWSYRRWAELEEHEQICSTNDADDCIKAKAVSSTTGMPGSQVASGPVFANNALEEYSADKPASLGRSFLKAGPKPQATQSEDPLAHNQRRPSNRAQWRYAFSRSFSCAISNPAATEGKENVSMLPSKHGGTSRLFERMRKRCKKEGATPPQQIPTLAGSKHDLGTTLASQQSPKKPKIMPLATSPSFGSPVDDVLQTLPYPLNTQDTPPASPPSGFFNPQGSPAGLPASPLLSAGHPFPPHLFAASVSPPAPAFIPPSPTPASLPHHPTTPTPPPAPPSSPTSATTFPSPMPSTPSLPFYPSTTPPPAPPSSPTSAATFTSPMPSSPPLPFYPSTTPSPSSPALHHSGLLASPPSLPQIPLFQLFAAAATPQPTLSSPHPTATATPSHAPFPNFSGMSLPAAATPAFSPPATLDTSTLDSSTTVPAAKAGSKRRTNRDRDDSDDARAPPTRDDEEPVEQPAKRKGGRGT